MEMWLFVVQLCERVQDRVILTETKREKEDEDLFMDGNY